MKRTLAVAALLTITGGSAYALANSHPAPGPYATHAPTDDSYDRYGSCWFAAAGEERSCNDTTNCAADRVACDDTSTGVTASELEAEATDRCEEDEACWDCATMGNLQCGPAPVAPRTSRAIAPTNPAITTLPDGNLTAIAQGPPSVPNTNPSPGAVAAAPTVSGASEGTPAAPIVWEWRSPTAENAWTQSSEGATGCWAAYGINGPPTRFPETPPEGNRHNWEVRRRTAAQPVACDSPDVQAGWDPTVPLEVSE